MQLNRFSPRLNEEAENVFSMLIELCKTPLNTTSYPGEKLVDVNELNNSILVYNSAELCTKIIRDLFVTHTENKQTLLNTPYQEVQVSPHSGDVFTALLKIAETSINSEAYFGRGKENVDFIVGLAFLTDLILKDMERPVNPLLEKNFVIAKDFAGLSRKCLFAPQAKEFEFLFNKTDIVKDITSIARESDGNLKKITHLVEYINNLPQTLMLSARVKGWKVDVMTLYPSVELDELVAETLPQILSKTSGEAQYRDLLLGHYLSNGLTADLLADVTRKYILGSSSKPEYKALREYMYNNILHIERALFTNKVF